MKRELVVLTITLCLAALFILPSVNAAVTIDDIFYQLDARSVTFLILWLVFFSIVFYSLKNVFVGNTAIPAVIALSVSFGGVYGIFLSGYQIEDLWNFFGINGDLIVYLGLIVVLILLVVLMIKIGFAKALMVLGTIIILTSFTSIIYEKTSAATFGFVCLVVGFLIWFFITRKKEQYTTLRIGR